MNAVRAPTAIITGAAGGLGSAFSQRLAAKGVRLVLADSNQAGLNALLGELTCPSSQLATVPVDISSTESIAHLVSVAIETFGGVDILVNNAAEMANLRRGPFEKIAVDEWDRVMAVNVRGTWLCVRAAAAALRASPAGRVVNIASDAALSGMGGLLHYSASKGAILAMTRALATELGPHGVTVNAIAPGFTQTPAAESQGDGILAQRIAQRAISRPQTPTDVVGALEFLVSEAASMVTGQTLIVNGGSYMH